MIIDFHTHIFPDKIAGATIEKLSKASDSPAYTDGTKDGLKRSMEESGVDTVSYTHLTLPTILLV